MLAERLGERLATLHGVQHVAQDAFQLLVVGQLGERGEAPVEGQAGGHERVELLRHDEEVAAFDAAAPERGQHGQLGAGGAGARAVRRADRDRDEAAIVQACNHRRDLAGLDRPLDDLPLRINRAILELRHQGSSRRRPSATPPRGG